MLSPCISPPKNSTERTDKDRSSASICAGDVWPRDLPWWGMDFLLFGACDDDLSGTTTPTHIALNYQINANPLDLLLRVIVRRIPFMHVIVRRIPFFVNQVVVTG